MRCGQIGAVEIGVVKNSAAQHRALKDAPAQIGVRQISTGEIRAANIRVRQVCGHQLGVLEIRVGQICSWTHNPAQTGTAGT